MKSFFAAILLLLFFTVHADAAVTVQDAIKYYQNGQYKKAELIYRKLSGQGNAQAMFLLGHMYSAKKITGNYDYNNAVKWWIRSANKGYVRSQRHLSTFYERPSIFSNIKKDDKKVVYWLRKAAEQGDLSSQYELGFKYHYGHNGLAVNKDEAIKWYMKAVKRGHLKAFYGLRDLNVHVDMPR